LCTHLLECRWTQNSPTNVLRVGLALEVPAHVQPSTANARMDWCLFIM
jgi:hypothetical protein